MAHTTLGRNFTSGPTNGRWARANRCWYHLVSAIPNLRGLVRKTFCKVIVHKKGGRFQVFHMCFFSDVLVYYLGKSKKNVMLILGVLWKRGVETCSTRNSPVASAAQHEKKPIPRKVQRKRKHLLFDTRHPKKSKVAADVSPKTCPTTLFTCTNGRTWGEKYFDTSEETGRVQTYLLESLRPLIYFSDFFSSHFLATFHSHNAPSTRHPKSLLSFHLTHASWYLGR